ncbi:TetR/AcrR family transcriptional regulator [Spongiibacter tropicus]|uniref:TetR/AcrR family transcriptional regulator n=1 Tax=Spongiibacter tropicus TaxID=454602 RepID=UPI002355115A|nr:TetR/AcrR family transcriptional regulator [Spongiibacter tropicus]|tara:strand:+ start:4630 stop:5256 length:627 start_codon:yes stop_codon:yes gene_type:complete
MSASQEKAPPTRLTQAQRRRQTKEKVLRCAAERFGRCGFAETSLADIAEDAGITVTPIYHYFGNKLQLFTAVTEYYEDRLASRMAAMRSRGSWVLPDVWELFLNVMQEPGFSRVVLMDATHVLGRERWPETSVFREVKYLLGSAKAPVEAHLAGQFSDAESELLIRMVISALAEAALTLAADPTLDARSLMTRLLAMLGLDQVQLLSE